jgi:D-alanine--poly(phosphoribitol) ligase subunit 1
MNQAGQITQDNFDSLRLMSFCGEPLLPQQLDILFNANLNLIIFNTYGPTEGTVFCTWLALKKDNYKQAAKSTI